MLWRIVAADTITVHDVSIKILRRFRAEHSCPHHKISEKGVLCAVLLLGALAHLAFCSNMMITVATIVIIMIILE